MSVKTASGSNVVVVAASGGPTQVTFAESTASPNNIIYVDSMTAAGSATDVDLALSPKGAGALTAHVADSTATGGNKRGTNAVDLQTKRTLNTHVANGNYAIIAGGYGNISSGTYGTVGGGINNTVSTQASTVSGGNASTAAANYSYIGGGQSNYTGGQYSAISGGNNNTINNPRGFCGAGEFNTINGDYGGIVAGNYGMSELYGKFAHAAGRFAATGDAQFGLTVCRATTTTNAAVSLTNNGNGTFSATNHLVLPNNRVYRFTIDLIASSGTIGTGSTTTYGTFGGVWTITGAIRRAATAATTAIIGTPTVLATAVDSVLAAVSFTVLAETTTYGSLQIVATGLATTQIHWVATIMTTEVG